MQDPTISRLVEQRFSDQRVIDRAADAPKNTRE